MSSFRANQERQNDELFSVDIRHIIGFVELLYWKIRTFGGVKSTVLGGEVFVTEFNGVRTIFIQSRSEWMSFLVSAAVARTTEEVRATFLC